MYEDVLGKIQSSYVVKLKMIDSENFTLDFQYNLLNFKKTVFLYSINIKMNFYLCCRLCDDK